MKRIMLMFLMLCAVGFGADQTITDVAGLLTAQNHAGDHTIDGTGGDGNGVYVLTSNWRSSQDMTLTAVNGPVVIDGDGTFEIMTRYSDLTMTGPITLRNTDTHGYFIKSADGTTTKEVTVNLTDVTITDITVDAKSGIQVQNNSGGDIILNMTNCTIHTVDKDGIDLSTFYTQKLTGSITGTPTTSDTATGATSGATAAVSRVESGYVLAWDVADDPFTDGEQIDFAPSGAQIAVATVTYITTTATLTDCTIYDTGQDLGGASGDAVTAHSNHEIINIVGGRFYNNRKSGVHLMDGAIGTIDADAQFWNNGTMSAGYGDIMYWIGATADDGSFTIWRNRGTGGGSSGGTHGDSTTGGLYGP